MQAALWLLAPPDNQPPSWNRMMRGLSLPVPEWLVFQSGTALPWNKKGKGYASLSGQPVPAQTLGAFVSITRLHLLQVRHNELYGKKQCLFDQAH